MRAWISRRTEFSEAQTRRIPGYVSVSCLLSNQRVNGLGLASCYVCVRACMHAGACMCTLKQEEHDQLRRSYYSMWGDLHEQVV